MMGASNVDKKPDIKKPGKMLQKANSTKERNRLILKAYTEGYSQHIIAEELGFVSAPTVKSIKDERG